MVSTRIVGVCLETVPDPVDLRSSDISTNSFRVSWAHPASDVVLYRLTWTPTDGEESNEVFMGFLYAVIVILSLEDERKSPGNLMIHLSGWKTLIFSSNSMTIKTLCKVLDWSVLKLNTCWQCFMWPNGSFSV